MSQELSNDGIPQASNTPTTDTQQAMDFLRVIIQPGQVFEVRGLEVRGKNNRTDSGYFDAVDDGAAEGVILDDIRKPRGVYVTLNPVNRALFARSANKIKEFAKETTSDEDIIKRLWLFIDLDPKRPSGISATGAEKEAAIKVAAVVREWLTTEFQFCEPLEVDSGNGRYLLWPIDLPNDESSRDLVSHVLKAVHAHCGTEAVTIDTTVSNAARIIRLPGTLNRKGDNIPERPHRRAALVSVPDALRAGWSNPLSREKLEAVAKRFLERQPPERLPSSTRGEAKDFEVVERARRYLSQIAPAVSGERGHTQTLLAAQHIVRGFKLSDDEAWPLLLEWNQTCQPPWDESDLRHKLSEARENGTAVEWGQHLRPSKSASGATPGKPTIQKEHAKPLPTFNVGDRLRALDRNNIGIVVEDLGESCLVEFTSADGNVVEKELLKSRLAYPDGRAVDSTNYVPQLMTSAEFAAAKFERHFLIKGILVKGQGCVVGGPQKACKTSLMVEMALALGCGFPFMGDSRFATPGRTRTCFLSGESGGFSLKDTAQRVSAARDAELSKADVLWGFDLPQLANPEDLRTLESLIQSEGIRVLMIDPAYLCLMAGDTQGRTPTNLFAMGSILKDVGQMGQQTGCTLVIAHHTRKARRDERYLPTSLEDLSMSGFPEWARQWFLIGRRAEFKDGKHDLWLNVGGSAGHSGAYCLSIDEGVANDDDATRKWEVIVENASESIERRKTERQANKKDGRRDEKKAALLDAIRKNPNGETKSELRKNAKLNSTDFDDLVAMLIADGLVEACEVVKNKIKHPAYKPSSKERGQNESESVGLTESC